MMSASVIESDEFVDMSPSAQALYMHLMFGADGIGCIDGVQRIMRSCGACEGDYAELLNSGFVITAESPSDKADVIAHWFVHNNLNDRDMSVGKHVALVDTTLVFCNRNDRRYVPVSGGMPKGYTRVHCVINSVRRALFGEEEPNGNPTGTQWEPNGNPTLKETKTKSDTEPDIEKKETRAGVRMEQCPECGALCLVASDPLGFHGYCDQCGGFDIECGGIA